MLRYLLLGPIRMHITSSTFHREEARDACQIDFERTEDVRKAWAKDLYIPSS
jgi:hypothetical protein